VIDSYFVCATPRTGSSLLLGLLESTGVAGHPQAYFRPPDEALYAAKWGLRAYDRADFVEAALAAGRTGNGVFGAKLMWDALVAVEDLLPAFGDTRFVFLRRDDVVAQAVSWVRAEQTGTWFAGGNGEVSGNAGDGPEPVFDREAIDQRLAAIKSENTAWARWFRSTGVRPLPLRYEDLAADPTATTLRVLEFLGLALPAGREIRAQHRRQADHLNSEWIAHYGA
jgi:LPS sulfotransferase NodH